MLNIFFTAEPLKPAMEQKKMGEQADLLVKVQNMVTLLPSPMEEPMEPPKAAEPAAEPTNDAADPDEKHWLDSGSLALANVLGYIFGYFVKFLPSLASRADCHPLAAEQNFCNIFLLIIPKSGMVPKRLSDEDANIVTLNEFVNFNEDVAGCVKRDYKTPIHQVSNPHDPREKLMFMGEFPSPLVTMDRIVHSGRIENYPEYQTEANADFAEMLQKELEKVHVGVNYRVVVYDDCGSNACLSRDIWNVLKSVP